MGDGIALGLVLAFFVASWALAALCQRLMGVR